MAAVSVTVDKGASGLLRHRFVRALMASSLVAVMITLVVFVVATFGDFEVVDGPPVGGDAASLARAVLMQSAFAILLLPAVVAMIVVAASILFDVMHRRIVALGALVVLMPSSVLFAISGAWWVLKQVGQVSIDQESASVQPWQMIAVILLLAPIMLEGVGWAWWQMTIPRADYFAARGWRPPPWRVLSTLRMRMGLPGFISNFGRGRLALTLIYFLHATLNLGLIALIVLPFVVLEFQENGSAVNWVSIGVGALLVVFLLLNLFGLGALLQRWASKRATKLYQDAREWDDRAPIVFLRAFNQDARKLPARAIDPFVKLPAGCGEARTVDEILLEHGSVYGPVIAIGDPRNPTPPLGAARVFVPGEGTGWQHVVSSLVGAAKVVIMSPSTSEGVRWELDLISNSSGQVRVILLANPELSGDENAALFARFAPEGQSPPTPKNQRPVAAYQDQAGWRLLTSSAPPCVQSYTVALNMALQAVLGMQGAPLRKPKRAAVG